MNCPLCSAPLLFGATSCPCGYNHLSAAADETLAIELSYWESLRAYWRIYWPTQLLGLVFLFALGMFSPVGAESLLQVVLMIPFAGIALYLFMPRIVSRPYRGFSLVVVDSTAGAAGQRLTARWRLNASFFLWWRQFVAGLFASLLAGPLNIVLSIMGWHVERWVADLAVILVIGPILLKMLIGNEFGEFRIEARRGPQQLPVAARPGNQLTRRLLGVAIILAALTGAYFYTKSKPSKSTRLTGAPIATKGQIEEPPTVLFDIKPANAPVLPGVELYDCAYQARGKTAKFRLEFRQEGPLTGELPIARASGKFLAMPGSDNSALLEDLLKALEAKRLPAQAARTPELPFDAVVLGEKQSRGASGGWAASPAGDWKAVKIFLPPGGDDAEMFLGLNPAAGKGEFSIKDPEYGDYLLAHLASVL